MQVTAYDTLSVTSTYSDASGNALGSVILVQGSPFVTYTAAADQTIPVEPIFAQKSDGFFTATVAGHEYGLVVGDGASVDAGGKVTLKSGSTITLFAAPDGQDAASLAKLAADPVVSTSVDHSVDGDTVKTTLNYVTKNGGDTAIAPMAGQTVDGGTKAGGTYASIYGTMDLYTGSSLTTTAPLAEPSDELDVSSMSDEDKQAVIAQIKTDAASIDFAASATDTYFGGKMLYRAANLMTLAEQLEVTDVADHAAHRPDRRAEEVVQPEGLRHRRDEVLRLRRRHQVDHRPGGVVRLRRGERPPLPLRLHALRRSGCRQERQGAGRRDRAGRRPARRRHRVRAGDRRLPAVPQLRPVLGSRVGLRFLSVRGREQPGVLQRVGQRLERRWPCGPRSAATPTCTTRPSG